MLQKLMPGHQALLNNLAYLSGSLNLLDTTWQEFLLTDCYNELLLIDNKLTEISQAEIIYPPQNLIFNALKLTTLSNTKIVILGQDPYHGDGEANGLAFAVNQNIKLPPSLKNIYKELSLEYGLSNAADGTHLVKWSAEGVLLLNSTLTVIKDRANSLSNIGWQQVTDKIISHISVTQSGVVFILWGANAQQKIKLIASDKHLILTAPHPSPLSVYRGFYGCNHFLRANEYLLSLDKTPINWF